MVNNLKIHIEQKGDLKKKKKQLLEKKYKKGLLYMLGKLVPAYKDLTNFILQTPHFIPLMTRAPILQLQYH